MRLARALRSVGELLVTAGVIGLLFVVYELYVTDLRNLEVQRDLRRELQATWAAPAPKAPAKRVATARRGEAVAVIHIPRLGRGYRPVVVEGVGVEELRKGPGRYPDTAMPGEVGNFAVAGHRTTYGRPFHRLDELEPGDPVVIETRDTWFTYTVRRELIVDPSRTDVVLPVPGRPARRPTERLLTFTTCHPKYSAEQRLVLHAALTAQQPKSEGQPAALAAR